MTIAIGSDVNTSEFFFLIMVTSNFTSKFKVMAFTLLGLSFILSLMLLLLTTPNIMETTLWNDSQSIGIFFESITILVLGCLPILKMKTIGIDSRRIVFQNYLFASNIREVDFKTYDYYKIVHEESENGIFEAVWLIKDCKLQDSFSTYQYSNYNAMQSALNLKNEGELDMSPLKQLLVQFGGKM